MGFQYEPTRITAQSILGLYSPFHLALTIRLIQLGLTNLSYVGGNTAARQETSILITGTESNPGNGIAKIFSNPSDVQ